MNSLREFIGSFMLHLSDRTLTLLADDEISGVKRALAKAHLARCRQCCSRHRRIKRVTLSIADYRNEVVRERLGELSSIRRDQFLRQLDSTLEQSQQESRWSSTLRGLDVRARLKPAPSLAGAFVLILLALIVSWHLRLPAVSASEIITRAIVSQKQRAAATAGVTRKRFRIKTTHHTFDHEVYQDVSGLSRTDATPASVEELSLIAQLASAGVNWDDPLNAASFKKWHDDQSNPRDKVKPISGGLLVLTSAIRNSLVASESLTVQADSFWPVDRTIQFRDRGVVDISEVGQEALDRREAPARFVAPARANPPAPVPVLPSVLQPSLAQINEAELRARLILNQQNGDEGEDIEFSRNDAGVQIGGLVETPLRKRQLAESLREIPFLSVAIESFEDLKPQPASENHRLSAQQRSSVAAVSPLAEYFSQHGRSRDDLSRVSAGLFNAALAASRSARSIDQLIATFQDADLTPAAIAARDELHSRLTARLLQELDEEKGLLNETQIVGSTGDAMAELAGTNNSSLTEVSNRGATLTQELVSGGSLTLSAGQIVGDLYVAMGRLRVLAAEDGTLHK